MKEELLKKLSELIADGENDAAVDVVKEALEAGIPPLEILNDGAAKGMDIVNDRYNEGEAFLPELIISGDAMTDAIKVIFASMSASDMAASKMGTVVIGQAKGDVHDIGKNIVAALLAVNGFEVHNLGIDVPVKTFIEKAEEVNADIIAVSTLLTTSLPYLEDTMKYLEDCGKRDKYYYIVGGGPVTTSFAEKVKADGWSRTGFDAVALCKMLVKKERPGVDPIVLIDSENR
jgi:corrinoid protein of di/trimethylamine methyltransferase